MNYENLNIVLTTSIARLFFKKKETTIKHNVDSDFATFLKLNKLISRNLHFYIFKKLIYNA